MARNKPISSSGNMSGRFKLKIKNISADISFDTGSSIISTEGKRLIMVMLDSIKADVKSWGNY